jgi:hypothetical protein
MVPTLALEPVADPFSHYHSFHYHPSGDGRCSMAGSTPASSDPIALSHPLPAASNPILSGTSDSVPSLNPVTPRAESHLTSIASAGLRTSPSPTPASTQTQFPSPKMTPQVTDQHPATSAEEKDRESRRDGTVVAREALGASIDETTHHDQDRSNDAVASSAPIEPLAKSIQISTDDMQVDPQTVAPGLDVSPGAGSGGGEVDGGSGDSATGPSGPGLINISTVASPGPIEENISPEDEQMSIQPDEGEHQGDTNKAFSYPPPLTTGLNDSRRGLSLPHSGLTRAAQRSSSTKKHRCPYCATEFTRHHNLKSHLLTHSQEKPYVCQTCNSRFRRLHDLKRHSKLHTGERPYICPKCERRFARGDALARHNKGQGGCAGRRASMGSFAGEDDYGGAGGADDPMDGLMYAEPERMDEEEERRLNIPSIRKHNAPASEPIPLPAPSSGTSYPPPRGPNTYPPIAVSRSPGGLFPPATNHNGSSSSTSPISTTGTINFPTAAHSTSSSLPSANITESPTSLSPNTLSSHLPSHAPEGNIHAHQQHRPPSPTRSRSFSQTGFHRGGPPSGSSPQPSLGLPPPQSVPPQLPLPPGMSAPDTRYSLHGQVQPSNLPPQHGASHSHSSSLGAATLPKPSGEPSPVVSSTYPGPSDMAVKVSADQSREEQLWAYIRSVHDELNTLRTEVVALRTQLASQNLMNSQSTTNLPPPNQSGSGAANSGSLAPQR